MDIKKLNEYFSPFKIEIICDTCQKHSGPTPRTVITKSDLLSPKEFPKTQHRITQLPEKVPRNYSHSKKVQTAHTQERENDSSAKNCTKIRVSGLKEFASVKKDQHTSKELLIFNPPNGILNLNFRQTEFDRKFNFQELFDSQKTTPNKIEEVEFDRIYHSERKQYHYKSGLPHLTGNQIQSNSDDSPDMLTGNHVRTGPEESPNATFRLKKVDDGEHSYYENLALNGPPSRVVSPFQTPFRRRPETPSHQDQTPQIFVQYTPNNRAGDNIDDGHQHNFDLLENPFLSKF